MKMQKESIPGKKFYFLRTIFFFSIVRDMLFCEPSLQHLHKNPFEHLNFMHINTLNFSMATVIGEENAFPCIYKVLNTQHNDSASFNHQKNKWISWIQMLFCEMIKPFFCKRNYFINENIQKVFNSN